MTNHIRRVELIDQALTPAGAEVWVTVHVAAVTPATEVRGRLMGPTCRYSSTVEVAYPLRPLARRQTAPDSLGPSVTMRVVIPEPSFWDPVSPFLYHGPVELWQDGDRAEQVAIRHGLCLDTLGPHGLRWNGKPLQLRGKDVQSCTEEEMLTLRSAGYNLLIAPISIATGPLWESADRIGFLMLGRMAALDKPAAVVLAAHPCSLGFLIDSAVWWGADRDKREQFKKLVRAPVGVELNGVPPEPLPSGLDFALCASELREDVSRLGLPVLVRN
jgi:hypothetical protein